MVICFFYVLCMFYTISLRFPQNMPRCIARQHNSPRKEVEQERQPQCVVAQHIFQSEIGNEEQGGGDSHGI